MNYLKYLFRRFTQNLRKAAAAALSSVTVIIVILLFVMSLTDVPHMFSFAMGFFIAVVGLIFIFGIVFMMLPAHRYDSDIIGRNFTGPSRMARLFRHSVESIFARRVNYALNGFMKLDEKYSDSMNNDEKALTAFYTGRCYDLMRYYPNASRYYDKAASLGMKTDVLTMLIARCKGEMGDMKEAKAIYDTIDSKCPLSMFVRTDIGRLYLRRNDAENALKWYQESIDNHENYAEALGGAAVANVMLHNFDKAAELYQAALLNHIPDPNSYSAYYKLTLEAAEKEAARKQAAAAEKV